MTANYPWGGLVRDSSGALYGIRHWRDGGYGTVYELSPRQGATMRGPRAPSTVLAEPARRRRSRCQRESNLDNSGRFMGLPGLAACTVGELSSSFLRQAGGPACGARPSSIRSLAAATAIRPRAVSFDDAGALIALPSTGDNSLTSCGEVHLTGCGTVFELAPPSGGTGPWTETTCIRLRWATTEACLKLVCCPTAAISTFTYQGGIIRSTASGAWAPVFEIVP